MQALDYAARSRALIDAKARDVTLDLEGSLKCRSELMARLVNLDRQIVSLNNEKADYETALARLDRRPKTFMPSDSPPVETSDSYIPNPFAHLDHAARENIACSDDDGLLLEAADQIGGMVYLDSDITLCGFTREGLIKFARWSQGEAR